MSIRRKSIMLICCLLWSGVTLQAQKKKSADLERLRFMEKVQVDGKLEEWGDGLAYYFEKQDLQYEIGNDEEMLYVAMRVRNEDRQMQALRQGFSFYVNTAAKKKEGEGVVFPLPDRESLRSLEKMDPEDRPKDVRRGLLNTVRAIYVKGLADVTDGPISLENSFGIKTAISLDSDAVCYEMAIPLARLGIKSDAQNNLAFQVKINGVIMRTVSTGGRMGGAGYDGYGYPAGTYGGVSSRREPQQEAGIWFIAPLAKPRELP